MVGDGGSRNIVVTVTANIASFTAGMNSVRSQLGGLQSSVAGTLGSMSNWLGKISNQMILTGAAGTGFSQYFIRMFGDALPAVEEYYKAQAKLISLMDLSTTSYEAASKAAWEHARALSESSIYTATEVTNAAYVIGQAGYKTAEIWSMLAPVLDLATAQAADLTQTAEDIISVLKAYNINATEAWKVTNLLAAGATASKVSMDDYHDGLKYIITAFSSLKYSIEDTITAFTLLTDVGYTGQNAGRILRDAMNDLLNPTAEALEVLRKYNVQLYTNQYELDALSAAYESVKTSVSGLESEQSRLNDLMEQSRDITEELNMQQQQLSIDAAKVRLKYNENNPILKSLEEEKNALVDARDAAKSYYDELKQAKKERQADITDQKSTVTDIRRQITAINSQMSFNRAQGYSNDTPLQIGLAAEKKRLQDELLKEQTSLDDMKKAHIEASKSIDVQKEKVGQANAAITEQNKKIKTEKERAAEAEQQELNAIEKKRIAIEEEKLAQQRKYNMIEEEQDKVNKQLDIYNAKLETAKKNMEAFVPEGLLQFEDILRSINSTGLSDSLSEMGKIFGKQSAAAMVWESDKVASGEYAARRADLLSKEGTSREGGEAFRQAQVILDSLYGQGKVAETKLDNTTIAAIQPMQEQLINMFKSITDQNMIDDITKIKEEVLDGILESAEKAIPTVKDLVGDLADLDPEVKKNIGAFLALSTIIMTVVTPALLTIGVFGNILKMFIDPLKRLVEVGMVTDTVGGAGGALGRAGAGGASAAGSRVGKGTIYDMWVGDGKGGGFIKLSDTGAGPGGDDVYKTFDRRYTYPTTVPPIPYDLRSDSEKARALTSDSFLYNGEAITKRRSNYYYPTGVEPIRYNMDKKYDSLGRPMPYRGLDGRFISQANEQSSLYPHGLMTGTPDLVGPQLLKKSKKNVVDPDILKQLDELENKLKLKPTGLASSLDDVVIAGGKAIVPAKNVGTEVGLLGGIAARVAPLLGFGGAAAGGTSVAGGLTGVGVAGAGSTGIIATVGTTLGALIVPIGLVIAALGLLYLAWTNNFMDIQTHVKNFMVWIDDNFGWIKDYIADVVKNIGETLDTFLGGFGKVWEGISNLDLSLLMEGLGEIAGSFVRVFGQIFFYAGDFAGRIIMSLIEGIVEGGPGFFEALVAFMKDIPKMLESFGQVVLFSAAEFGMSFINALLGVKQTDAEKEAVRSRIALMMDTAYAAFGRKSDLTGYVQDTNAKRAQRQAEKDKKTRQELIDATTTGLKGADKAGTGWIDTLLGTSKANKELTSTQLGATRALGDGIKEGESYADHLRALGFTNIDTTKSLSGLTTNLGNSSSALQTVTSGSSTTKEALEKLRGEADKPLIAPNYEQEKFNTFNNNIEISIGKLKQLQYAAGNTNITPYVPTTTPVVPTSPVQSVVQTLLPTVTSPLTSPSTTISGHAPSTTTAAPTAAQGAKQGQSFIGGLVAGMATGLVTGGPVGMVAGGIASLIGNFFPRSPAKLGALNKLPEMGSKIPAQLADGMRSELAQVTAASQDLANKIKMSIDTGKLTDVSKEKLVQYKNELLDTMMVVNKLTESMDKYNNALTASQIKEIADREGKQGIMKAMKEMQNTFVTAPDGTKMMLQAPKAFVPGTPLSYRDQSMSTPLQKPIQRTGPYIMPGASQSIQDTFNFTFNGSQNKQELKAFGKQLVSKIERGRGNFKSLG